jgi:glycosyltransferase involved in cell wall biosynthesis
LTSADDSQTVARALDAGAGAPDRAPIAAIGISIGEPCGVHDHAVLLDGALAESRFACTDHWLWRRCLALRAERAEVRSWIDATADELARARPDAVLLHYSIFAFSHRGLPVFVRPLLAAIGELRLPLVTLMHELAYPWRIGGARGKIWAATQRAALVAAMRSSAEVVVTGGDRADWLRTRAWLPRRPISVAPVFSNLPAASVGAHAQPGRVGLFGYAYEGVDHATVLDALGALRERGHAPELVLLGAPGGRSAAAARWREAAAARGLAGALSFSGRLPAQELSDALAGCAVLLFADRGGPTSRKTTLAASLSSGRPVVALNGRNSWSQLLEADAAVVVEAGAIALAGAIDALLADESARALQGARGRDFASATMSVGQSARIVGGALTRAIERSSG